MSSGEAAPVYVAFRTSGNHLLLRITLSAVGQPVNNHWWCVHHIAPHVWLRISDSAPAFILFELRVLGAPVLAGSEQRK